MDLPSPDGMGGSMNNSAIYSVGRTELVYNKSSSLTSPRVLGNGLSRLDDGDLLFITLPPGIDSGHPTGWEGINTRASWDRDSHLQSQESLGSVEEYYMEGAGTAQRHAEAMFNADTE
jgi:nuclear factor related to kappa-B-binding protein